MLEAGVQDLGCTEQQRAPRRTGESAPGAEGALRRLDRVRYVLRRTARKEADQLIGNGRIAILECGGRRHPLAIDAAWWVRHSPGWAASTCW